MLAGIDRTESRIDMADSRIIQWFSELDRSSIPVAGGKGANLAELYRLKLPVPPGFVVTTVGYRHFVEANDLQDRIMALAAQGQAGDAAAYEVISAQIRVLFTAGDVPESLVSAVSAAYLE